MGAGKGSGKDISTAFADTLKPHFGRTVARKRAAIAFETK
jgi:hypothetical protein